MTSRFKVLLVCCATAVACKTPVITSSPPPPSPPPPPPPPPPANHAPVAVIGGPYNSTTDTVVFDGSQSSDPDGDAITFSWTFGDGTTGNAAKVTHVYQADGNYNVSLLVTDPRGAKDSAATTATVAVVAAPVLVGAGNIASGSQISERTAELIDQIDGTVFTTGDNAFPDGTDSAYAKYYANTWGRFLARTRPTLGNHDYQDANAKGSFDYFRDKLGTKGYYSYDLGTWHVIVLNDKGGTDRTYPALDPDQMQWLHDDLEAHKDIKCTIAMWHIPLFNSSNQAGWIESPDHKPIWDLLYQYGVDVVLNGQQHNYERFAPMDPSGNLDSLTGIREFNVGTGGESVDNFTVAIHPHSEIRAAVFGVLKLTLKTDGYDWQFVPVAGATFTDSGSGKCH